MPGLVAEVRAIPAIVGVMMVMLSNRLWVLDTIAEDTGPLPWLGAFWPWWFLAAGIACTALFLWPHQRAVMAVSGAMVVSGLAWRAVAVMLSLVEGTSGFAAVQLHIAGIVYTLAALLTAVVWLRVLRPAATLLARTRTRLGPDAYPTPHLRRR